MKVLVTGASGFIGKNLCAALNRRENTQILHFDLDQNSGGLETLVPQSDFIFHLAGVNRTNDPSDFESGNVGLTGEIIRLLELNGRSIPMVISSSIQAEKNNHYGNSKRAAEDIVFSYATNTGSPVFVYRLANVFGKWCRPNYNSVVATFCHNIARGLPIQVNDPEAVLRLVYIDDIIDEFLRILDSDIGKTNELCTVKPEYTINLSELATQLKFFHESRTSRGGLPKFSDPLIKKLYSTYITYLPENDFAYPLAMNTDGRGSFTEFLRTPDRGQVSINISKPGITKGNHWHNTKTEKFLVVSGKGVIHLRNVNSSKILSYNVSGDELQVVDIPPGYTHDIENTDNKEMVTVMWANEIFDPDRPDTYFLEV